MNELRLGNVAVDCDDAEALCEFYHRLLGWERKVMFGQLTVCSRDGIVFLFAEEEDYIRPTWPEKAREQQKQMHFDFQVKNVGEEVNRAISLGATPADEQFGGEDFVTLLDPAGHPFCLCSEDNPVS